MRYAILFLLVTGVLRAADAVAVTGPFTISGAMQTTSGSLGVPAKANSFSPSDTATRVALNPTATWANGGGAVSYDVYGDSFSPPTTLRSAAQAGTSYGYTVDYNTTFYWKINPKNSFGTTTGDILSFASVPAYTADLFTGFENGSDGATITPTIMSNGQFTSGGTWTWTVTANASAGNGIVSTTAQKAPYSALLVSATPHTDAAGTRGLSFGMDTLSNYTQSQLPSLQDHVTMRFNMSVGPYSGSSITVDGPSLLTEAGGFILIQVNSSFQMQAHADMAGAGSQTSVSARNSCLNPTGGTYVITADTWYQIVIDYIRAGDSTIKIYDATGVTLLKTLTMAMGVSSCDASAGAYNSPAKYVQVGRTDAHAGTQPPSTSRLKVDGLAISLSGATIGP